MGRPPLTGRVEMTQDIKGCGCVWTWSVSKGCWELTFQCLHHAQASLRPNVQVANR